MSKYFYGDPMQFKLTLFFSLLFSSFPVYSIEGETFFNYAKEIVIQMEKDNELEGKTKHRVMKEMLSTKDLTYECSRMDFNKITYDHCAMSQDVMRLPDDRTGGFVAGMAGAAAERVLERVYDRVIDRGLDQVKEREVLVVIIRFLQSEEGIAHEKYIHKQSYCFYRVGAGCFYGDLFFFEVGWFLE
jgi:hypothetical protein